MIPILLPGLTIDAWQTLPTGVGIAAHSTIATVPCPDCSLPAARVHSRYIRSPRDLSVSLYRVQLRLQVRRFFCDNPRCVRRTFCERLPDFLPLHAQRTLRLTQTLHVIAIALGGRAGAQLAQQLRVPTSRSSLGRVLQDHVLPQRATPRVLGVDDFALRRGQRYGTILVDLEQHCPVDLLPDRTAATLTTWLQAHPGVEIVTRDRALEYRRGISAGAPTAIQVADRWHLLANLREAVERVLDRIHGQLQHLVVQPVTPPPAPPNAPVRIRCRSPQEEQARTSRRDRRHALYEAVRMQVAQGVSRRQIALDLGVSRWLVHRYADGDGFPERAPTRVHASILKPYALQLNALWDGQEYNTMALYRALQASGYCGSTQTVRRWVQQRRLTPAPRTSPQYRATYSVAPHEVAPRRTQCARLPAARRLSWLFVRDPTTFQDDEHALLTRLRQDATVATAYTRAQQFVAMVRYRQEDQLAAWLTACQESGVPALSSFADGLQHDEAAVRAALSMEWSNGQTEGQVNRLKLVKRQMYGRASFEVLRRRVLGTPTGDHGS